MNPEKKSKKNREKITKEEQQARIEKRQVVTKLQEAINEQNVQKVSELLEKDNETMKADQFLEKSEEEAGDLKQAISLFLVKNNKREEKYELYKVDGNGFTALHTVCTTASISDDKTRLEIAKLLLSYDSEFKELSKSNISDSRQVKTSSLQTPYHEKKFINQESEDHTTALEGASRKGHLELVKLLLENGADINQPGKKNTTPLCSAIKLKHNNVVKELINRGADISQCAKDNSNPMQEASKAGNIEAMALLIQEGVNIKCINEDDLLLLLNYTVKQGEMNIAKLSISAMLSKNLSAEKPDFIKTDQILSKHWDSCQCPRSCDETPNNRVNINKASILEKENLEKYAGASSTTPSSLLFSLPNKNNDPRTSQSGTDNTLGKSRLAIVFPRK